MHYCQRYMLCLGSNLLAEIKSFNTEHRSWINNSTHKLYLDGVYTSLSWWRHQMETFSALLAICAGNSPVPGEFPHKGQWRRALMFTLICVWINGCVNNREAGDLRRYCAHYGVTVMFCLHVVTKIYGNINTFCDSMKMETGYWFTLSLTMPIISTPFTCICMARLFEKDQINVVWTAGIGDYQSQRINDTSV